MKVPARLFDKRIIIFCFVVGLCLGTINNVMAPMPDTKSVQASLFETLKSVTSNVSSSVTSEVDKIISETMDITINDAMNKLENATIYGTSDSSTHKFEPEVPTSIDLGK
ncbi:MAG TPA: hypothetical protein VH415_04205 [Nitrososphaeraceae archaeon]|jgi:hypothetical protein